MVAVYYQIFQAAKRIVDEEKKAQSHLLLSRSTATVNISCGGAPETVRMICVQQATDQESGSSRSNSLVVCHPGQNGRPPPAVWPDVCSAAGQQPTGGGRNRPSLDIPRCPRRRYSSTTSTMEMNDTYLTSLNNITAQQQQSLLDHSRPPACPVAHSAGTGRGTVSHQHSRVRLRFALNKERKVLFINNSFE